MNRKIFLCGVLFILMGLGLAACSGATTPTWVPAPATVKVSSASTAQPSASQSSGARFETKSHEGGSVTVKVTPLALGLEQPLVFDLAMDTHSVDLSDDLTKIVIVRDDAGKEYAPIAWEGAGPGGHHREGKLKFAALTGKPKYVELVIKGLARVPERVFRWELS